MVAAETGAPGWAAGVEAQAAWVPAAWGWVAAATGEVTEWEVERGMAGATGSGWVVAEEIW